MYSDYESELLRGIEEPRAWNLQQEISKHCHSDVHVLDVGCGTMHKWCELKDQVASLTGLEQNPSMLRNAEVNLDKWNDSKVKLIRGNSHNLPFADNSFDLVTAIMAPCADEQEVFRVLKPGGAFLMETSTEMSQRNLKKAFGKDELGWRGINCELQEGEVIRRRTEACQKIYGNCEIRHKRWRNWLSSESLYFFLEQVPVIREYGKPEDKAIVEMMLRSVDSKKGYLVWQDRILLVAHKLHR